MSKVKVRASPGLVLLAFNGSDADRPHFLGFTSHLKPETAPSRPHRIASGSSQPEKRGETIQKLLWWEGRVERDPQASYECGITRGGERALIRCPSPTQHTAFDAEAGNSSFAEEACE